MSYELKRPSRDLVARRKDILGNGGKTISPELAALLARTRR